MTATTEAVASHASPAPAGPTASVGVRPRLIRHVALYVVLLVALVGTTALGSSWTSDDGAYAVAARAVRDTGSFAYRYERSGIDPAGKHFPFVLSSVGQGRYYPYVREPAWVALLAGSTAAVGSPLGLHLPSLLGLLAAAVVAWALAARFDRRLAAPAFWAVGLGPTLIQGFALWAHAPATACGGLACLAVVRLVDRPPTVRASLGLGAALAALVALRPEGLLFAVSALGAVAVMTARRRALVAVVPAAVVVGATHLTQNLVRAGVAPGVASVTGVRAGVIGWVPGRISGAWSTLIDVGTPFSRPGVITLAGLALLVGAAVALRRDQPLRVPITLAGTGVAALALRSVLDAGGPHNGLLGAWGLAVIGLGAWTWRGAPRTEQALALVVGLFTAAVLLTQYPEGGGREWGGRFLAPMIVPVAVLALRGAQRSLAGRRPAERTRATRVLGGLVAASVLVPTVAGLVWTSHERQVTAREVAAAVAPGTATIITTRPHLPRLAWATVPRVEWLVAPARADVGPLLRQLRATSDRPVTVTGGGVDQIVVPGYARTVRSADVVVFTPR